MIISKKNNKLNNVLLFLLIVFLLFISQKAGIFVFLFVFAVCCYFVRLKVLIIEYFKGDNVLVVKYIAFLFWELELKLELSNIDLELRKRFIKGTTYPELYFYLNGKKMLLLGDIQNVNEKELFLLFETIRSNCKSSMSMYEQ